MTAAPIAVGAEAEQPHASRRFLFVACFVALVATSFAFIIRVMLMEQWQIEFGLSETQKGEIFGAGMWPFGLSIVLFSLVIDRIGYGKSMIFAFACHLASAVLMVFAEGYWWLYVGSILNGLAAGTVEAVINPAVASIYTKSKTKMLTVLHAGWPGGFVLGGISLLILDHFGVGWRVNVAIILVPTLAYGLMLLKAQFPVSERVVAGIPYKDMLKEAGALGWLIVVYMVCMEINRVITGAFGDVLPAPLFAGNFLDTAFFDLPSIAMTILMGILVVAYLLYTKSLGRPMYIFLLLVMILLAITELGTDTWIKDLMKPAMTRIGLNAGLVLVYTATIMMILRFCIGPIIRVLKPLGVLLVGSLFAAAGLYLLSGAQGGYILLWATVYGTGQTFFWPVTLGLVSERFPRGGALTLNAIAGVGMLGVGIVGSQLLGFWQDTSIDRTLQPQPAAYERLMSPAEKESIFGSYRALDQQRVNEVSDETALYEYRQEAARGMTPPPTAEELTATLADDLKYQTLVRNAYNHLVREPGDTERKPHDVMEKALEARGILVSAEQYEKLVADRTLLDHITTEAKRDAMSSVSILPLIMAFCYLGLILYFRAKGGYAAIDLTDPGRPAGEHKPTAREVLQDEARTPDE